ncbi:MAG: helix-turn-helix transcriptional regulator [Victivallaceae bacterium]|nr:helix-turn-helix transcriptional regulator [Victivallaceae bacterium]
MRKFKFNTEIVRNIYASNFVSRTPPYSWTPLEAFIPQNHFLYFQLENERVLGFDGVKYMVRPGDILIFFKGIEYYSELPEKSYKAINISFSIEDGDALVSEKAIKKSKTSIYLPFYQKAGIRSSIHYISEDIVYSNMSASPLKNRKASFLLTQILIEIIEQKMTFEHSSIDFIISKLERSPNINWKIDELANSANMSRASLTRAFRKATGKSIQQFHIAVKMKHAQSIMRNNTEIKVREVAQMLNFYDEYHFSKTFKKNFGYSPLKFKKHVQV